MRSLVQPRALCALATLLVACHHEAPPPPPVVEAAPQPVVPVLAPTRLAAPGPTAPRPFTQIGRAHV